MRITRDGPGQGEEYQITHPEAQVNGILKGSYYGTMSDTISVTCRGGSGPTRLRVLIEYKEEVSVVVGLTRLGARWQTQLRSHVFGMSLVAHVSTC